MHKITPNFLEVFKRDLKKNGGVVECASTFINKLRQESPEVFEWVIGTIFNHELKEINDRPLFTFLVAFFLGCKIMHSLSEAEIMDLEELLAECDSKTNIHKKHVEFLEGMLGDQFGNNQQSDS